MTEHRDFLFASMRGRRPEVPDPGWEHRIRVRCHEELARQAARRREARRRAVAVERLLQGVATAGLMLYLAAVLGDTMRLAGWL